MSLKGSAPVAAGRSADNRDAFSADVFASAAIGAFRGLKGLILFPVIARTLGVVEYGAWVQAITTATVLTAPAMLSLDAAVVRLFPELEESEWPSMYSLVVLLVLVPLTLAAGSLVVFADTIAAAFFSGAAEPAAIVRLATLLLVGNVLFGLGAGLMRAELRIQEFARLAAVRDVAATAIAIALAIITRNTVIVLGGYAACWAMAGLALIVHVGLRHGVSTPDLRRIPALFRFSAPLTLTHPLAAIAKYGNTYVIAYFLGLGPVAVYGAARVAGDVLRFLSSSVTFALGPRLAHLLHEMREERVASYLNRTIRYFVLSAVPLALALAFWGAGFLEAVLGSDVAPRQGAIVFLVLMAMIIAGVYAIAAETVILTKDTGLLLGVWAVAAVAQLGITLLLIPTVGVLGAGFGDVVSQSCVLALILHASRTRYAIALERGFLRRLTGATVLGAAVGALGSIWWGWSLGVGGAAALVMIGSYPFLGVMDMQDLKELVDRLRSGLRRRAVST